MAEIFLAETSDLPGVRRVVVLKRMLPELARDDAYARMFLDEARILASLAHPNVVQIVEVGRDGDNLFMAMEHVDGVNLVAVMEASAFLHRRIPLEVAVHVISSVLTGLHYVHEKRDDAGRPLHLIHRDISPRNVLVTWEGAVKLIDFGIARPANRLGTTREGQVRGTVPYMSPEQCRGRHLDRRTDVYSTGILLYELTVGRRLYTGENEFEVFEEIVRGQVPRPSTEREGYPPQIEAVVMRALAPSATDRYGSAGEMLEALDRASGELGLLPSPRSLQAFLRTCVADGALSAPGEDTARRDIPPTQVTHTAGPPSREAPPRGTWGRGRIAAAVLVATAVLAGTGTWRLRQHLRQVRVGPPATQKDAPPAPVPPPGPTPPAQVSPQTTITGPSRRDAAGELVIEAVPWCQVIIDGKERGPTPVTVRLPAGPHQVQLRNDEFGIARTVRIAVAPGRSIRRRFDFPRADGTPDAR